MAVCRTMSTDKRRSFRAARCALVVASALVYMGLTTVTNSAVDAAVTPHLTPDTAQVAYLASSTTSVAPLVIGLADADGWNQRTVNVPLQGAFLGLTGSPSLSPDGSRIAFEAEAEDVNLVGPCDNLSVGVIDADGSGVHVLPDPPGTTCATDAVWSPTGTRLAVDATSISTIQPQVWTENPDGTDPVLIGAGSAPSWSPDGSQLAFLFDGQIYRVGSGGGPATRITSLPSPENVGGPLWSPTGTEIAFASDFPPDPGLVEEGISVGVNLMSPDGTNLHYLLSYQSGGTGASNGASGSLSWAPDGTRLLVGDPDSPAQGYSIRDLQDRYQSSFDVTINGSEVVSPSFISAGGVAPSPTATTPPVVGVSSTPSGDGYWKVSSVGGVFTFGDAGFFGSMGGQPLNQPVVGMASTADGRGYWLVAADGGVFSFGDAQFHGSMGGLPLNQPIVGIADDPATGGYWEVAGDGGIFSFNAPFLGSTGNLRLNQPVVTMASTPTGAGYWFVAADGGVFAYGDAPFEGSLGSLHLNRPVTSVVTSASGHGYQLVASDGGIFSFGDSAFHGSMGEVQISSPVIGIAPVRTTGGYRIVTSDGGTFDFDATPL